MAFTLKNLENLSGSGAGKKLWTYDSADALATIVAADYFLSVTNLLSVGDVIYVEGSDGTMWLTVTAASSSTVTVGPGAALEAKATWDPGSLADGAGETKSVTVTGAALGDFVIASFSLDLQDMTMSAYVQAADTVEVRLQNESGGTIDLSSGSVRVRVFKPAT